MKRLVLDPNTLVSGIAAISSGSPPAQLVRAMQAMRFEIAICPEVLREVNKALRKPYFRERVTATEASRAVARIEEVAIPFDDPSDVPATLRDPRDDYLLAFGPSGKCRGHRHRRQGPARSRRGAEPGGNQRAGRV